MDPFRRGICRRDPFDFFNIDDVFERMFRDMENMIKRGFYDFPNEWMVPGKSFIHGFNINIEPDGKPHIQEFGNRPLKTPNGKRSISDEREPITDIIEGDDEVAITVEIPGIEKEDIDMNVNEATLEISVDNAQRIYHKMMYFPCEVLPKTTKATYKNGILDVVIKRKERRKKEEVFRVKID